MIIRSAELKTVCGITSTLPANEVPEFAFSGKSNVGKSSLINAILNRKSLARTSSEPGKTQTINFYEINKELFLVDLPGYGFARVSQETKEKWGKMIERYLRTSRMLRKVFLLVDMRHEPSANDIQMYEWIKANGFTPVVVMTKSDKLSKKEQSRMTVAIRKALGMKADETLIAFSAQTKQGVPEIHAILEGELKALKDDEEAEAQKNQGSEEKTPEMQEKSGTKENENGTGIG